MTTAIIDIIALSAPKICTVLAGCLAKIFRLPACAISLAPTSSPTNTVRLGGMTNMQFFRYSSGYAVLLDLNHLLSEKLNIGDIFFRNLSSSPYPQPPLTKHHFSKEILAFSPILIRSTVLTKATHSLINWRFNSG